MYSDEEGSTQQPSMTKDISKDAQHNLQRLLQVSAIAWMLLAAAAIAAATSWTAAPTTDQASNQILDSTIIDSSHSSIAHSTGRDLQETNNSNNASPYDEFQQGGTEMVIVGVDLKEGDAKSEPMPVPDLYPSLLDGFEWVLVGSVPRPEVENAYERRRNVEVDLNVNSMNTVISLDVTMDGIARHPSGPFDSTMAFAIVGPLLARQPDAVYGVHCEDDDLSSSAESCSVHMASETAGGRKLFIYCICVLVSGPPYICDF